MKLNDCLPMHSSDVETSADHFLSAVYALAGAFTLGQIGAALLVLSWRLTGAGNIDPAVLPDDGWPFMLFRSIEAVEQVVMTSDWFAVAQECVSLVSPMIPTTALGEVPALTHLVIVSYGGAVTSVVAIGLAMFAIISAGQGAFLAYRTTAHARRDR